MRPVWMIRAGLWLYDHLGGKITLPGSKAVSFPHMEFSAGLKADFRSGFVYSDCRVDDSRLTILNAVSAREKGAHHPHAHALRGRAGGWTASGRSWCGRRAGRRARCARRRW